MSTSGPIRTAVLGTGLSGLTFHVPFILALPEQFTLQAVLERNPKSEGGKLQERFGVSVKIHRSLEEVLGDEEIDLVVVGTPNETHYPFAKAALEAGKHVLVDKPVTVNSAQAKELGELAKSKKLVLYAFQNRRWDSDFLALRRLLALPPSSGQHLGEIYEFESRFDRYRSNLKGTWKDESGACFDLGSHLIDQSLVLFGLPAKLTAFTLNSRNIGNPDIDDSFTIMLHYPPGPNRHHPLTAILRGGILSVRSQQLRYTVRGTKGTFQKYGVDVQEDQLKIIADPTKIRELGYGKEPEKIWGTVENLNKDGGISVNRWPSNERGNYADLFINLGKAIQEGEPLAVKWNEATAVVELLELAYLSSKEGRTVDVPATLLGA